MYVDATVPDSPLLRGQAALELFGGRTAFVSHATAARIHGVPVPALPDEHETVLKRGHRRRHDGIKVHCVRSATVVERGGIKVSSYEQMFVELASLLTLVDLVVVGDNLVRTKRMTPKQLGEFCAASKHPAARAAARAAAQVRENVDSPMETRHRP